jgi:hypothetical protein
MANISTQWKAVMDDAVLDAEAKRATYCIDELRKGDMSETATNILMEKLSDNANLLDEIASPPTPREDALPFQVRETTQGNLVKLTTRIGVAEMSDVMQARLRSLYVNLHSIDLLTPSYLADFSRAAFLLLYRYSYTDPGLKRQGFLGPRSFEAISKAFDAPIDLEAFAAAFNTTVPRYCSLFPDVESPFGSLGSFFDLAQLGDNHLVQVSPPRIGVITMAAVEHCVALLKREKANRSAYHMVLLTPLAWDDVNRALDNSGLVVWKNRVKRGDQIEYYDVVRNTPSRFPHPRVTILSNVVSLPAETARLMHLSFSRQ